MKLANILRTASVLLTAALPLSVSAAITQFTFVNGMTGANETTPNASAGLVTINSLYFDTAFGANGTLFINLSYSGLSGTSSAYHIHGNAAPGFNAPVIVGLEAGNVLGTTSGTLINTYLPGSPAAVANLFGGLNYLNLHTSAFPGGEIRGQLTPVPEPSAYGLIAGAFILGVVTIRRRNVRSA